MRSSTSFLWRRFPRWVAGRLFYALVTQALRCCSCRCSSAYVAYDAVSLRDGVPRRPGEPHVRRLRLRHSLCCSARSPCFSWWRAASPIAPSAPHPAARDRAAFPAAPPRPRRSAAGWSAARRRRSAVTSTPTSRCSSPATPMRPRWTRSAARPAAPAPSSTRAAGCGNCNALRTRLARRRVFVSRFVQTHVRIRLDGGALNVALWEHPRPAAQRFRVVERLLIAGGMPVEPAADAPPRIRAVTTV